MKDPEFKFKPMTTLVPVIQAPELIKVRTISPKVVEQLPWITLGPGKWDGQEIIGRLPGIGVIITRHVNGHLSRASDMVYMEARAQYLIENLGKERAAAIEQANAEIASLPQIFGV